jgi:hypothetical protein
VVWRVVARAWRDVVWRDVACSFLGCRSHLQGSFVFAGSCLYVKSLYVIVIFSLAVLLSVVSFSLVWFAFFAWCLKGSTEGPLAASAEAGLAEVPVCEGVRVQVAGSACVH